MKKIFLLLMIVSSSAQAFLSHGYNIEELSSKSDQIFLGEVTKVEPSVISSNSKDLPYVRIYFKVFENIKGQVSANYSFKQFAPKVGKQFQLLGMGNHAYNVGEKLVMFMGSPSPKTGFSAPVDFQLFLLQTKSNKQSDIDKAIVLNKQFGEKTGSKLFENLQKPSTQNMMEQFKKDSQFSKNLTFLNFRSLIQASVK